MKLSLLTLIIAAFLNSGCAAGSDSKSGTAKPSPDLSSTPSYIKKDGVDLNGTEATPLNVNGELVLFFNDRNADSTTAALTLLLPNGATEVVASGYTLGSAIVVNGNIIVFGTLLDYSRVDMFQKINGTWVSVPVITPDVTEHVFNTSVTATPNGYTMAYEVLPQGGNFTFKYATSNDLVHWMKLTGLIFQTGSYTACPTIRYFSGLYYVTYLVYENGLFVTRIAKSSDLTTWTVSLQVVLSPSNDEGRNASDVDFVEINGQTIIYYIDGDQQTWSHLRRASYNGGLEQFLMTFF